MKNKVLGIKKETVKILVSSWVKTHRTGSPVNDLYSEEEGPDRITNLVGAKIREVKYPVSEKREHKYSSPSFGEGVGYEQDWREERWLIIEKNKPFSYTAHYGLYQEKVKGVF